MRVYVPATDATLAELASTGVLLVAGPVFAVTPSLRAWVSADDLTGTPPDDEELELVALTEAGRHSLRLLAAVDPAAGPVRRVVVAADVDAVVDDESADAPVGQVRVAPGGVTLARTAAVLVDGPDVAALVTRAVRAVEAADAGDVTAEAVVAELEGQDLLWFDADEITALTPR